MSQPANTNDNDHISIFRIIVFMTLFGMLGFIVTFALGVVISAVTGLTASGMLINGQVLAQFGYTNASKGVTAQGLSYLNIANAILYILSLAGAGFGMAGGYFWAKHEKH
ncbi:hypothetical protein SBV1_gp25 [Sulfolobales Beppu virus 1]|nr:hypothetical protein SBV1_gp25 [Sulfolobales Beppu virus 1]